jgi:WD40 repeat protein
LTKLATEAEYKLDKVWTSNNITESITKYALDTSKVNIDRISKDCLRRVIKEMSFSELYTVVVEFFVKQKIALKVKEVMDRKTEDCCRRLTVHRSTSVEESNQGTIILSDEDPVVEIDENEYQIKSPKKRKSESPSSRKKSVETVSSLKVTSQGDYNYTPFVGIRSHCFEENPLDNQTQVWKVAFEPQVCSESERVSQSDSIQRVATCGGNHVCIMDGKTGKLLIKFSDSDPYDDLYALAWTTIRGEYGQMENILAVGGTGRKVILLHPASKKRITKFQAHHHDINVLLFHPEQTTLLFSGSYDKKIKVWDIKPLVFCHEIKKMSRMTPLLDIDINNKILTFSFSILHNMLFIGGESGMTIWKDICIDASNDG